MLYKRCQNCGRRVPINEVCPCVKARSRERHKAYDSEGRDRESKAFYNSIAWQRTRERVLAIDGGIDVYLYMTKGIIKAADTIHHIVPLKDDYSKRLDTDNLMSLNHGTHSEIESMYDYYGKKAMEKKLSRMLKTYRKIVR